jgi:hypothetical protein
MENTLFDHYFCWVMYTILTSMSLLGVIYLATVLILENECWKKLYNKNKRRNKRKLSVFLRLVTTRRHWIISQLLLGGLAYVYATRPKFIFLPCSITSTLLSLEYLKEYPLAIWISGILLFLNFATYWMAKNEMKVRFSFD